MAPKTQVEGIDDSRQKTLSGHHVNSLIVTFDTNARYGMANILSTRM
jgi:hypothetical protein